MFLITLNLLSHLPITGAHVGQLLTKQVF